jgi:hypothetical protein
MGTHQGGNGGNVPPDGDRTPDEPVDLPELPPEWGDITIPDDPSELAAEAELVRQELAARRRAGSFRRRDGVSGETEPSIGVPLLIMSVAVLITLISLFLMAWSGSGAPDRASASPPAEPVASVTSLPSITLADAQGDPVRLAGYAPAMILLVEGCPDCAALVSQAVATAPAGVTVLAVDESAPSPPPDLDPNLSAPLLLLADPDGALRTDLGLGAPPAGAITVVLVDQDRTITRTVPAATTTAAFEADLAALAPR